MQALLLQSVFELFNMSALLVNASPLHWITTDSNSNVKKIKPNSGFLKFISCYCNTAVCFVCISFHYPLHVLIYYETELTSSVKSPAAFLTHSHRTHWRTWNFNLQAMSGPLILYRGVSLAWFFFPHWKEASFSFSWMNVNHVLLALQ